MNVGRGKEERKLNQEVRKGKRKERSKKGAGIRRWWQHKRRRNNVMNVREDKKKKGSCAKN